MLFFFFIFSCRLQFICQFSIRECCEWWKNRENKKLLEQLFSLQNQSICRSLFCIPFHFSLFCFQYLLFIFATVCVSFVVVFVVGSFSICWHLNAFMHGFYQLLQCIFHMTKSRYTDWILESIENKTEGMKKEWKKKMETIWTKDEMCIYLYHEHKISRFIKYKAECTLHSPFLSHCLEK